MWSNQMRSFIRGPSLLLPSSADKEWFCSAGRIQISPFYATPQSSISSDGLKESICYHTYCLRALRYETIYTRLTNLQYLNYYNVKTNCFLGHPGTTTSIGSLLQQVQTGACPITGTDWKATNESLRPESCTAKKCSQD